jgi:hypothetical protein
MTVLKREDSLLLSGTKKAILKTKKKRCHLHATRDDNDSFRHNQRIFLCGEFQSESNQKIDVSMK